MSLDNRLQNTISGSRLRRRQREQSSGAQDSVDWILTSLQTGLNLDCWHTDAPTCTHCQTLAPQARLPSALHAMASGTESRKDRFFCWFVCLFVCCCPGYLRSAQPLTLPEREGIQDGVRKKCEGTERQKTS